MLFIQLALVVPLVLILPILLGGNVIGVWLALPINDIIILLIALILLAREYKYLNKISVNCENAR